MVCTTDGGIKLCKNVSDLTILWMLQNSDFRPHPAGKMLPLHIMQNDDTVGVMKITWILAG